MTKHWKVCSAHLTTHEFSLPLITRLPDIGWKCLVLPPGVLPWTEQPNEKPYSLIYSRHLLQTLRKGAGRDAETFSDYPTTCPRAGSTIPKDRSSLMQRALETDPTMPGADPVTPHLPPWQLSFLHFCLNFPYTRFIISWPVPRQQAEQISPFLSSTVGFPEGFLKDKPCIGCFWLHLCALITKQRHLVLACSFPLWQQTQVCFS